MQDRGMYGGWAMVLVGALGCGPGQDISLGSEAPLRSELGDGGGLEPDAAQLYPPSPEARHCAAEVERELEIDFQLDVATPVCPPGSGCELNLEQIVPANDGSLWVRGAWNPVALRNPDVERTSHLWLAHVASDGTMLGTTEIEMSGGQAMWTTDLAVDDRGEAWLASWEKDSTGYSTGTRVRRYDAAVQPTGTPSLLEGWTRVRMANAPGRGVVAAGFGARRERMTALLDGDATPRWILTPESEVGLRSRPVVGPSGQIVIASAAPGGPAVHYFDDGVECGPTSLQAYGPDGTPLWSRDLGREVSGTSLDWWFFSLMSDSLGNLTVAASETAALPESSQGWVLRLGDDGGARWLWQVHMGSNNPVAVEPATGRTFVADYPLVDPYNFNDGVLVEISADGETCRKYGYSDIFFLQHLASSAAGELFFAGGKSVGRFRPIGP